MLTQRKLATRLAALLSFMVLLAAGPALAVSHVRGTVSAVKDGAISVQTAKGDTQEIKSPPTPACSWSARPICPQ